MKQVLIVFFSLLLVVSFAACGSGGGKQPPEDGAVQSAPEGSGPAVSTGEPSQTSSPEPAEDTALEEDAIMKMNVQVDGTAFTATLEQNAAVDALVDMMRDAPVVIQMSDYSGFEKVGSQRTPGRRRRPGWRRPSPVAAKDKE